MKMRPTKARLLTLLATVALAVMLLPYITAAENGLAQAEKDGFRAIAFFSEDEDWKERWYRSSHHSQFNMTDRLKPGEEATLLVGFIDAAHGANGKIDIRCDLETTKSDGSSGGSARDVPYAPSDLPERPGVLIPTFMTVTVKADDRRKAGQTLFEVGVTDAVGGTRLDLGLTLTIEASE